MKGLKKILACVIALGLMAAMSVTAFAQNIDSGEGGDATITISNASKGETYKVSKLFDATVTGTAGGSIAYTGMIPEGLEDYFVKDGAGNISLKDGADISDTAFQTALKTWAADNVTATAVSDGSELVFSNLQYGYYVVTTTQGKGLITVDSTNPNAKVVDKNSTEPVIEEGEGKKVDNNNVKIGDMVTYTIRFTTSNYSGAGTDAKQIYQYTIADTLPDYLGNVTVKEIKVVNTDKSEIILATQQFSADKKIVIPWVNNNGNSLYENKADLVITYTAVVTAKAAIDGEGNKNEVTITYQDKDKETIGTKITSSVTIYTYAIAIQKVDQSGNPLAGATFELPFYVQSAVDTDDGAYIYAGTASGSGLTNTLTTPADGLLIIKGVSAGNYSITETAAPAGYNMLTSPVTVTATQTGETTTTTTTYLDKDGNIVDEETTDGHTVTVDISKLSATPVVVVNKTGSALPSTGGIGTSIFYIVGAILVLGAGIILITRRRMAAK